MGERDAEIGNRKSVHGTVPNLNQLYSVMKFSIICEAQMPRRELNRRRSKLLFPELEFGSLHAVNPAVNAGLNLHEQLNNFFVTGLKRSPACESIVPEYGGPGVRLLVPVNNDHHGQGRRTHLHASNNQKCSSCQNWYKNI
jgi:hypothetical protein